MGFNRFALLDFIANPPVTGNNSQAWLEAWYVAQRSVMFERSRGGMSDVLGERLPDNSPSGHWVLSMGAVVGGDESMRGAGSPKKLREARDNPLLQNSVTQANRKEMEANLSSILASLSMPRSFPVIFVNCRACGKIHRYNLEQEICGQYK